LAATEATYKNEMQASASANEIFQQTTKNISDIMANPDLDATAKQNAVNAQKSYLQGAMNVISVTSGIPGLKNLINF
jgi:vacuolar-type H+-ATPase subunit H